MKKIACMLPHILIILSLMFLTFFIIDRMNSAMQFLDNDITDWLLCVFAIISLINAGLLIRKQRRDE